MPRQLKLSNHGGSSSATVISDRGHFTRSLQIRDKPRQRRTMNAPIDWIFYVGP
jgi:hypothetical protein